MGDAQKFIFGRNAVLEAIRSEPEKIEKIYLRFGLQKDVQQKFFSLAKKNKIRISIIDKTKFDKIEKQHCGDKLSQGVLAIYSEINYLSLDELIVRSFNISKNPILAFLDRINDPQNLGAIARSVECSGANGLILTTKESSPITPFAIKASAGALFHLPISRVENSIFAIEKLKNSGFWIVGTSASAETIYDEINYNSPIVIILGNEGKGIFPSLRKHCDFLVRIPINGEIKSLNASVSAGVLLFEIQRQRRKNSALLSKDYSNNNQYPTK